MLGKNLIQAAAGAGGEETDENFANTVLLLHGDGNQGATNFSNAGDPTYLAFKDNSSNNFPITVNGDAYGDNFGPYALDDGYWGNSFNTSTTYLTTAADSNIQAGTGNITVEAWVYVNALPSVYATILSVGGLTTGNWQLELLSTGKIRWETYSTVYLDQTDFPLNEWFHVAVVRSGTGTNELKLYLNGVNVESATCSESLSPSSYNLTVGASNYNLGNNRYLNGYISNLRYKKSAVYTSGFTPSTSPLTSDANTVLLTCQSNRFVDNGNYNYSLTATGTPSTKVFNPFGELPDGVNGSGFFDGTGDYLFIPSDSNLFFSSGDWTIEFWMYAPNVTTYQDLIGLNYNTNQSSIASARLTVTGGQIQMLASTDGANWTVNTTIGSVSANTWTHIAYTRSSTTLTLWINGISAGTASISGALYAGTYGSQIGNVYWSGGNFYYSGNISNVRVVKGTAVYTSAFTPPASPLTAVSGTELLTCQYAGTVRNVGFIDSGPYDFPVTRYGNTTQGTFSPFSKPDGRWGNYFDGSNDYLTSASDATAFVMGSSGDFTVECFIYPEGSQGVYAGILMSYASWGAFSNRFALTINGSTLVWLGSTGALDISASTAVTLNAWNHVAVVRSGSTITMYLNGSSVGTTTSNQTFTTTPAAITLGLGNVYFKGYISNARVVKGTALYTGSFTPSTTPLTAVANTQLLTCQSNRFVDNSSNAFAMTPTNEPKVTPFSPFPLTTEYSPSVNGGSGYFDGSGDYLSGIGSASDFNFIHNQTALATIQGWVYRTSSAAEQMIFDNCGGTGANIGFYLSITTAGNLDFNVAKGGGSGVWVVDATSSGVTIPVNAWTHIAVTYDYSLASGNVAFYINGTAAGTANKTANAAVNTNATYALNALGLHGGSFLFFGYAASLRISNNIRTGLTSIPTAPYTSDANTKLLLNFTNAGIFDNTGFNNLETVGNAQIDTTTKKYGTGAMKFDGTGDYLIMPDVSTGQFGTGDFTVEYWDRHGSQSTNYAPQVGTLSSGTPAGTWRFGTFSNNSGVYLAYHNGSTYVDIQFGSTAYNDNTWRHFALTRSGTTVRAFVDGVQVGTNQTVSQNFNSANRVIVGAELVSPTYFNGYIDDLRITKGVARYTSNFTVPDKAFPNTGV